MSFQNQEIKRLYLEYSKRSTNYKPGKEKFAFSNLNLFQPLVVDFHPDFYTWLNLIVQSTQEKTGQNPSLEELAEGLNEIFLSYPKSVILRLTFREGTKKERDEILNQIKKRLTGPSSPARFRKEALDRYLRVFDLRKEGLKWKEVFLDVYDNMNEKDLTEDRRRALQNDLKRAKTIIRNIENNRFPWWT